MVQRTKDDLRLELKIRRKQLRSRDALLDDLHKKIARLEEKNEILRKEVNRCHARLEIDHYYTGVFEEFENRVDIPLEERLDGGILKESDGIAIRDLQIQLREDDLDVVYMKGIRRGIKAYMQALSLRMERGEVPSFRETRTALAAITILSYMDKESKKHD